MLADPSSLEAILLLRPADYIPISYGVASALTRLGEAQVLLPAMLAVCLWLVRVGRCAALAWRWLLAVGFAGLLATASKVAFFGYEWGYAPLDYAGLSGHALFSAAILPVLLRVAFGWPAGPAARRVVAASVALALLIALTRVKVGAHSWIEVLLGFALGTAASLWALRERSWPVQRPSAWLPVGVALWLAFTAHAAPPSQTHGMVQRLSVFISGRAQPYSRQEMRSAWYRARQAAAIRSGAPAQR